MKMPYKCKFKIASGFGMRIDPINGKNTFHSGLDLVSLDSKDVLSIEDGVVVRSRIVTDPGNCTSEWGNYIAIRSTKNEERVIYYCHLSKRIANYGDIVKAGDIIGIEGSIGRSTGSHLHLEVRLNNISTDPSALLSLPNKVGYIHENKTIPTHDWSKEAVEWAVQNKIILGDGSGDIRLTSPITREECTVLLHRIFKILMKGE